MANHPNFLLESTPSLTSINSLMNTMTNHSTPPLLQVFNFSDNNLSVVFDHLSNSSNVNSDGVSEIKFDGSVAWHRVPWKESEDRKLISLVKKHGTGKWTLLSKEMPGRNGKQCRERWQNNLRPNIKKMLVWTEEEERILIQEHERRGNRWAEIARCIPNRSENAIKNHWNSTIRKLKSTRVIHQSTLLQEYIKKMFLDSGSASSSSGSSTATNPAGAPPCTTTITQNNAIIGNVYGYSGINALNDDETISNFTVDTHDEEMSFMRNLFQSNGNNSSVINAVYN